MIRLFIVILSIISIVPAIDAQTVFQKSRISLDCRHHDIRRCIQLDVFSPDIPDSFNGLRLAFLTDIHYASRFDDRSLEALGTALHQLSPDAILLGGDYQEGCEYVEPLFTTIMATQPRYGGFAVMGNNDYERCTDIIHNSMLRHNIHILESAVDSICINGQRIFIAGAHNDFSKHESSPSPTLSLKPSDFVILLTHTPDYVEDQDCKNTDLALAGHLHGGQVTLFGLIAPVIPSHYGQRFRHGLKYSSQAVPVLCSNGIGTSRKALRFCAAPEIHLIVLHHTNN